MERPYILELPVELLQHIAGFCGRDGLLMLRLVCSDLDAATLDNFAFEWVEWQVCFLLDPRRLVSFRQLFSFPRLARRLEGITFSLDPLENQDYEGPLTYDHRHDNFLLLRPQYDKCMDPPERDVLISIFHQLEAVGSSHIMFELCDRSDREIAEVAFDKKKKVPAMASVLQAGLSTNLGNLHIVTMEVDLMDLKNALRHWSASLQCVLLREVLHHEENHCEPWHEILQILGSFTQLDHLVLDNLGHGEEECATTNCLGGPCHLLSHEGNGKWQRKTGIKIDGRDDVVSFLEKNIEENMPVRHVE